MIFRKPLRTAKAVRVEMPMAVRDVAVNDLNLVDFVRCLDCDTAW